MQLFWQQNTENTEKAARMREKLTYISTVIKIFHGTVSLQKQKEKLFHILVEKFTYRNSKKIKHIQGKKHSNNSFDYPIWKNHEKRTWTWKFFCFIYFLDSLFSLGISYICFRENLCFSFLLDEKKNTKKNRKRRGNFCTLYIWKKKLGFNCVRRMPVNV